MLRCIHFVKRRVSASLEHCNRTCNSCMCSAALNWSNELVNNFISSDGEIFSASNSTLWLFVGNG